MFVLPLPPYTMCEIVTASWFFIMKNWCCWFMFDVEERARERWKQRKSWDEKVNHTFFNNMWKNMKFMCFYWSCIFFFTLPNRENLFLEFFSPLAQALLYPPSASHSTSSKHTILRAKKLFRTNERMRTNESMTKFCGPEIGSDLCCGTFYGCRFRQ